MEKNNLILVGSSNPTKVNSVSQAFSFVYPDIEFKVLGKLVKSGVSNQPMGEDETLMGAENRMKNLLNGILKLVVFNFSQVYFLVNVKSSLLQSN